MNLFENYLGAYYFIFEERNIPFGMPLQSISEMSNGVN